MTKTLLKVLTINLIVIYSIVRWQDDTTGILSLSLLPLSLLLLNKRIEECEEKKQES